MSIIFVRFALAVERGGDSAAAVAVGSNYVDGVRVDLAKEACRMFAAVAGPSSSLKSVGNLRCVEFRVLAVSMKIRGMSHMSCHQIEPTEFDGLTCRKRNRDDGCT